VTTTSDQPSLRSLARHLGCSHAALSKKVHSGLLTAGVRLDDRGRVAVTDFAAAAEEWHRFHVPSVHEMTRRPAAQTQAHAPTVEFFADLSKQDLLEAWAAFDLLARALVLDAVGADSGPPSGDAFTERVTAHLRRIAPVQGADDVTLAGAGALLRELVTDHRELAAELLTDSEARRQEDDAAAMATVAAVDHRG
jgi:hypothetical protein